MSVEETKQESNNEIKICVETAETVGKDFAVGSSDLESSFCSAVKTNFTSCSDSDLKIATPQVLIITSNDAFTSLEPRNLAANKLQNVTDEDCPLDYKRARYVKNNDDKTLITDILQDICGYSSSEIKATQIYEKNNTEKVNSELASDLNYDTVFPLTNDKCNVELIMSKSNDQKGASGLAKLDKDQQIIIKDKSSASESPKSTSDNNLLPMLPGVSCKSSDRLTKVVVLDKEPKTFAEGGVQSICDVFHVIRQARALEVHSNFCKHKGIMIFKAEHILPSVNESGQLGIIKVAHYLCNKQDCGHHMAITSMQKDSVTLIPYTGKPICESNTKNC